MCGEHVADRINSSPYGRSEEIQDGTQHFGSEANPLNVWSLLHKGLAKEPTLRLIRKRRAQAEELRPSFFSTEHLPDAFVSH